MINLVQVSEICPKIAVGRNAPSYVSVTIQHWKAGWATGMRWHKLTFEILLLALFSVAYCAEGIKMAFYSLLCVTFSGILKYSLQALSTLWRGQEPESSKVLKIMKKEEPFIRVWCLSELNWVFRNENMRSSGYSDLWLRCYTTVSISKMPHGR